MAEIGSSTGGIRGVPPTFQSEVRDILDDEFGLLVERQKKYGSKNIEQGGILGCLIRAGDKLERLKLVFPALGITGKYKADYPDESIEDAMLDLANYATIALMLYRGTWGRPLAEVRPTYEKMKERDPSAFPETQGWQIDQLESDDDVDSALKAEIEDNIATGNLRGLKENAAKLLDRHGLGTGY